MPAMLTNMPSHQGIKLSTRHNGLPPITRAVPPRALAKSVSAIALAMALSAYTSAGEVTVPNAAVAAAQTASAAAIPKNTSPIVETAGRAYDFTNAMGVRMHLDANNGPNSYIDNFDAIGPALNDLKIKYVRMTSQNLATDEQKRLRVTELHRKFDIKFLFVFGSAIHDTAIMKKSLDWAAASGAALGFEGPNEWSKFQYAAGTRFRKNWATEIAVYQKELYDHLRSGPWPTGPIVGPSIWFRDNWAMDQLKGLGVDQSFDVANLHYYHRNTQKPTQAGRREPNFKTPLETDTVRFRTDMDGVVRDLSAHFKPGPYWVTETGEQLGSGGEAGNAVSEVQSAKYVPRLMMEFFKRGASKIFLFELMDQAPGNYGFLRKDKTKRPSYDAVRNLMNILDDTATAAPNFTPQKLNFSLTGTGISHTVLQKADGSFYVVLWKDVVSNDTSDQAQPTTLTWNFSSPGVESYYPRTSGSKDRSWANVTSVPLVVRDDLLIVKITK